MTPLLINEKAASILLDISVSKLQKSRSAKSTLIAEGTVPPYVKIDGKILYVYEELVNFVKNLPRMGAGGKTFVPTLQEKNKQPNQTVQAKEEKPSDLVSPEMPDDLAGMCDFL